ncbi:MAG: NmrA family NAD(P)-binding protein [Verrucomicrobia bacterium]|nr:NmrA family NAD(P)-binding protein [Cytophagales bacterium]
MYVITGATGNTGKRIAEHLLQAGKAVTVVSRNATHVASLVELGAKPAIGNLEDTDFLTATFAGAEAVYALIPPNYTTNDFTGYQISVGNALASAIEKSGVKNVVVLSSVGANLSEKSGVILGMYSFEQKLKQMAGLNTLALRPGFFMQNFYGNIGIIKNMGINGGFPIDGDIRFGMIHVNDIADYAIKRLLALDFKGFSYQNLSGERELTLKEATTILGTAIGKPDLQWVTFSYEQAKGGMMQAGLTESLADKYVEFGERMNDGTMTAEHKLTADSKTATSIETFAQEFAGAFQHS